VVTTSRTLVGTPAIVSASLAPVFFIGGTIVAGLSWPAYDPVRQSISELAALDAPTRVFTTVIFVLAGLCHITTTIFARGIGKPGRIAYFGGALASLAVAAFPLPNLVGTSLPHKIAATIGFILLAAWPLLGIRRGSGFPWAVRPAGAIIGAAVMTVLCLWFLAVWATPALGYVGLIERIAADAETVWPLIVVITLARHRKKAG
jgi:hypothetical membrane protein